MRISEMPSTHPLEIKVLYAGKEHVLPGRACGPVVRSVYIIECCTDGQGCLIKPCRGMMRRMLIPILRTACRQRCHQRGDAVGDVGKVLRAGHF